MTKMLNEDNLPIETQVRAQLRHIRTSLEKNAAIWSLSEGSEYNQENQTNIPCFILQCNRTAIFIDPKTTRVWFQDIYLNAIEATVLKEELYEAAMGIVNNHLVKKLKWCNEGLKEAAVQSTGVKVEDLPF